MKQTVTYLREGRKLRATGVMVANAPKQGLVKVKPHREDWGHVWITREEIAAGQGKPLVQSRKPASENPKKTRKPRAKKQPPKPRWQQLIHEVRTLEIEHVPDGWPCVRMRTLTELANELEAARAKLAEFLPVNAELWHRRRRHTNL
jgi:hypothetical protein